MLSFNMKDNKKVLVYIFLIHKIISILKFFVSIHHSHKTHTHILRVIEK